MFASNSLKLSFKLFLLTDVGNCCKERETKLVVGMEVNAHHTEKLLKEINRALLPCQCQSEKLSLQSYELPAALTFRWVNAILIVLLKYY